MPDELATMAANGALPVSARERLRFIPAHYYEAGVLREKAPVYILAALTITERRALHRAVVGACGMFVQTKEIRQALRDGAIAELDPEAAAAAILALDQLEQIEEAANPDESTELLLASLRERVTQASMEVSRLHRPL